MVTKKNSLCTRWIAAVVLMCCAASGWAQNDFFSSLDVDVQSSNDKDSRHSLLGWVNSELGYGLQDPGPLFSRSVAQVNKAEISLFTQWESKLGAGSNFRFSGKAYHDEVYRLQDSTPYSTDEINEFRNRFEVRDLYVEHDFGNGLYVKAGNQILAWGMSEYLRVTDLINIENQYTFGQQDLEDLRLQVPALLTSASGNGWTVDAVLTYQAGDNDIAPAGDEFDQFAALRVAGVTLMVAEPERQEEFFVRASSQYSRGDIQIVAGEFNDNSLSLQGIAGTTDSPLLRMQQNRMRALGMAVNRVSGSWLLFSELGIHRDKAMRPLGTTLAEQALGWQRKDQLLAVIGADYSGFRNLVLSAELDTTRTRDNDSSLYGPATQTSYGLRAYWTALNERLQVIAVSNQLAEDYGRIDRLSVDYEWSDNLSFGLLWVNYSTPGDSYLNLFGHNDVFNLRLRYSFQSDY